MDQSGTNGEGDFSISDKPHQSHEEVGKLYGQFRKTWHSYDTDAEDALQNVIVRHLEKGKRLTSMKYIEICVRNERIDNIRKESKIKRGNDLFQQQISSTTSFISRSWEYDGFEIILMKFEALLTKEENEFILASADGNSTQEMAILFGKSEEAIRALKSRTRRKLKALLENL